jgi:hypothetical protein
MPFLILSIKEHEIIIGTHAIRTITPGDKEGCRVNLDDETFYDVDQSFDNIRQGIFNLGKNNLAIIDLTK